MRFGMAAAMLCCSLSVSAQTASPPPSPAPRLEFVFEEVVTLAPNMPVGQTPRGKRNYIPITGGTFAGPALQGRVLGGGWDWQLTDAAGCLTLHADYMIQTRGGATINVVNGGSSCPDASGKLPPLVTTPVFEAPEGAYGWLNGGVYVGTVDGAKLDGEDAVRLRFYRVRTQP